MKSKHNKLTQPLLFLFLIVGFMQICMANTAFSLAELKEKKVAIAVFSQDKASKKFERMVQSRLEDILSDNEVEVLDRDKVKDLKNVWKNLEDPGYFVTAEDFVNNAASYELDGLIRVYLGADVEKGLADYYSATGSVDIRVVKADAKVSSATNTPMGGPGKPPSDGLTKSSAIKNALQRALDEAVMKVGFKVFDEASPRSFVLNLGEPSTTNEKLLSDYSMSNDESLWKHVELIDKTWTWEVITGTVVSPGNSTAALAGYITDGGPRSRTYSSKIHLLDVKEGKEISTYNSTTKAKKARGFFDLGVGISSKVLDMMFLGNWRYLAAVSAHGLIIWDTERGRVISSVELPKPAKMAQLLTKNDEEGSQLIVKTNNESYKYALTLKK
ncbi:MAG: hypothetical protein HQL46_00735 [Gammaproteobacteria bacterium]|nr:hypothetical protein [Gammaproteobacteria bacterium]